MDENATTDIATLPGFAHFTPEFQRLLASDAKGEGEKRADLLEMTREAVAVLAELELLQFVYLPTDDDEDVAEDEEDEDVAWFSVDGVEIDEERDAVMLIGDVTHLYGGPITLEGVDDDEPAASH
ncbi:MAG: hypothetical protein NVS2B8_19260 [Vulcanimicrobiaceae bacterium]